MAEPTWLQPMIDQRLALMLEQMGAETFVEMADSNTMVMTPLTEPSDDNPIAMDFWDRCCDNCKRYVKKDEPSDTQLITGHKQLMFRGCRVVITFGACTDCASIED